MGLGGLRSTTLVTIYRYISKCSTWPLVFKSNVCHLGSCITQVFKMVHKMAANGENRFWDKKVSNCR